MALPKSPYDNKKHYDSGRLRHKIEFKQDVATDNPSGGTTITEQTVISTWAGKEEVSAYRQNALNAGQTNYNSYQYFVMRHRLSFYPTKSMRITYGGKKYIIIDVEQLDDPITFLKITCQVSE